MWAEIDDAGMWRCFDCDEVITVHGVRSCKSQCDVAEMMADAVELEEERLAIKADEEAAFAQAEADYYSGKNKASKRRKTKKAVQQKLPIKADSEEDVAPF